MSIAQFSDVYFGYPGKDILGGASLLVRPGDRIALLGPNGTGKSTALKLLTGELQPDRGDARVLGRAKVGYLCQSQSLESDGSVLDTLLEPFADLRALNEEMAQLTNQLPTGDPRALARFGELQERYTDAGGYEIESQVRRLLADVGLSPLDLPRPVSTLSGGERGRLELAKVLVQKPELLLLDEPTNHLDLAAIERLENHLRDYAGAFLLVSHDRAFIQRTCREMVELEDGRFVRYPFGYERYVLDRSQRLARARLEYERQKQQVDKTEDFIRRNIAGQKTKQAQSRRKLLERLDRLERPTDHWELAGNISLRFSTGPDLGGKEVIRAPELTVGYHDRTILRAVTVNIYRGDRVGIVGPNGCGKSTLLRTLVGELPPRGGDVLRGSGVRLGYYDQKLASLDETHTLLDEVRSVRADLSPEALRQYLARFRFVGDDPFRQVASLSGGERGRLSLAKMMLFPRNLLALDEPTNHLDIPAREVLEEALVEYSGTLLVVSHDRYFLDRVCGRLLVFTSEGLESHLGNYSDWRARLGDREAKAPGAATAARPPAGAPPEPPRLKAEDNAAGWKARERRRLERRAVGLEKEVQGLEEELRDLRAALASDHGGDWKKLHELADKEREGSERLTRQTEAWKAAVAALAEAERA